MGRKSKMQDRMFRQKGVCVCEKRKQNEIGFMKLKFSMLLWY